MKGIISQEFEDAIYKKFIGDTGKALSEISALIFSVFAGSEPLSTRDMSGEAFADSIKELNNIDFPDDLAMRLSKFSELQNKDQITDASRMILAGLEAATQAFQKGNDIDSKNIPKDFWGVHYTELVQVQKQEAFIRENYKAYSTLLQKKNFFNVEFQILEKLPENNLKLHKKMLLKKLQFTDYLPAFEQAEAQKRYKAFALERMATDQERLEALTTGKAKPVAEDTEVAKLLNVLLRAKLARVQKEIKEAAVEVLVSVQLQSTYTPTVQFKQEEQEIKKEEPKQIEAAKTNDVSRVFQTNGW